jgi:triphosphoribosyl-dephospho-CoA synthase
MSRRPVAAARRSVIAVRTDQTDDRWPLELATMSVWALVEGAELTPKPALVDRRGGGAQSGLDLIRLRRAATALKDGFAAIARTSGSALRPSEPLREELGLIGRTMEREVLAATAGHPAHRGAIWTLGLLVAAAARRRPDRSAMSIAAGAAALAVMPDRFAPDLLSRGDRARLRFGAAGARGEAQAAFPHVIRVGLPALRAARARDGSEDHARLDALVAIMSRLEDTGLLNDGGRAALSAAQAGAKAVIDAGGTSSRDGWELLLKLDAKLMALRARPGGSATLLSATLFLDRLESLRSNP